MFSLFIETRPCERVFLFIYFICVLVPSPEPGEKPMLAENKAFFLIIVKDNQKGNQTDN